MSSRDFRPKVSSSLPKGFRSVKLNFGQSDGESNQPISDQSTSNPIDVNNNHIHSQPQSTAIALPPPTDNSAHQRKSRSPTSSKHAGNRHGLYQKQTQNEQMQSTEVARHSAPATSPPPPPVPPPPTVNADAPIYLQPYEVPPETSNAKPFWSLPENEQRAVLQQLSRSPSPVVRPQSVEPEQIEHVITDRDPPSNAQFLYETDSHRFYSVPTGSRITKVTQSTTAGQAVRAEGIGPVNESGVPVALRTGVKEEYASDWYKTMFKTLHKADKPKWMEEEPVTVRIPRHKSPKKDFKLDSYNEDGRRSKNEHLTDKYTEANQYRRYQEEERRKKEFHKESAFLSEEPNTKYVIKKKKTQKSKSPVPKKTYVSVQRGEEIPFSGLSKPAPIYRPRGFYEQKQQEQVFFTPNQSPIPPPNYSYDAHLAPESSAPARPQSPSYYNQTLASTSPGFSLHSIDEWQRRQDEDLNQIYCTIRRNHEVNRLKETGQLISPQPEQRPRSSHQLYQKELQSSSLRSSHIQPTPSYPSLSKTTNSHLNSFQQDNNLSQSRTFQPKHTTTSTFDKVDFHQTSTSSSQRPSFKKPLVPPPPSYSSECTSSFASSAACHKSHTGVSTSSAIAPVPPARPSYPSQSQLLQSVVSIEPRSQDNNSSNIALYAVPSKQRTVIEQTYYDRERFDQPQLVQGISLDRKWNEARLDSDWSSTLNRLPANNASKSYSDSGAHAHVVKPLPVQPRNQSYHTIGRSFNQNSSAVDSLGLRTSASLGNLASCTSPTTDTLDRLTASKGHSISLAEDVNNVSFAQNDDDDDLDKLIKKIEQDAIIQDELDNYNTTQVYQTPILNKLDPNFQNDVNRNRFLLQKHYEHDHSKGRSEDVDIPRRHHYSPNPESVVHLNRFEKAYREKEGAEIRHKAFAKVLRDFRASRDNEISVKRDDIVIICRQIDSNWVEIEDTQSGLKGFVPRKYLDFEQEGLGTVKFDFYGQAIKGEISLRKGEGVKVIRQIDENWFRGVNSKGEVGIFPCSYVDMLKKPLTEELHINLIPGHESPIPSAHSPSHLSPQACSVTRTLPANTVKQLTSQSADQSTARRPVKMYRVQFNYTPQQSDELQLIAGDLIEVSLECDDGWFVGRSSLTGKTGMFPGNYVERML